MKIKMTLFKKIFLTIFVGLFVVETINVYLDYQNICIDMIETYIDRKTILKLQDIEEYFERSSKEYSNEEILRYVQNELKDYYGYYELEYDGGKTLYENERFPEFREDPCMYILPTECFQKGVACDSVSTYISLKNISKESLNKLERYIRYQPKNSEFIVNYAGEKERVKDEETGAVSYSIEPTFLEVNDLILLGERPSHVSKDRMYSYTSEDLYYFAHPNDNAENATLIYKDDLLESSQWAARTLYDEYSKIGRMNESVRVGYERQDDHLMMTQRVSVKNNVGIMVNIICVNFYPNVFNRIAETAIQRNLKIYVLTLLLSFCMSLLISYMITRRIKKIEISTKEIADNHFDIRLNEKTQDELGSLSHSINEMSSKLKTTIDKLNEEIENVKKLESLRKEFIANFTHEIKTPLGIIDGYIELVEASKDEDKKLMYLQAISQETARINELVLAMLNLSRLESGKIDLNIQEVDLEDLISSNIDSYAGLLEKKKIQVELSGEEVFVRADPVQLQMVIKNFMSNAIKHTPETMKIYVHYDSHILSIENEGSHIDEDKMETIWETYVSSDREGTGLGLAICKTILDMHGFNYKVENTEKGVRFIVEMKTEKD